MLLIGVTVLTAVAVAAYTPKTAQTSMQLNGRTATESSRQLQALNARTEVYQADISSVEQLIYDIEVEIGDQNVTLLVDSGSYSLWTVQADYRCTDGYNNFTQATCGLVGTYEPSSDPTTVAWDDVTYYEDYGSGYAQGAAYNATVKVAGLVVSDYPIGYASEIDFQGGDGRAAGIIGLGIGVATGFQTVINNTLISLTPTGFFSRLRTQLDAWEFAITLDQGLSNGPTPISNTGELALGGLTSSMSSSLNKSIDPLFASVPISAADTKATYTKWGGIVQGWTYPTNTTSSGFATPFASDVLFDSGTAFLRLDVDSFTNYNQLWSGSTPRFQRVSGTEQYYYIDCNATAPDFAFLLGGETRNVSSADLIYRLENGTCRSSVTQGVNSPMYVLGAPFFKSNVVVFDGDAQAIHVATKNRV